MKMRAAFIVAIFAASLSFVGCDMILEELYPEFKEGGSGKGGLVVEIGYDSTVASYNYYGKSFAGNQIPLRVALVPFSQSYNPTTGYYEYKPIDGSIIVQKGYSRDFAYDASKGRNSKSFSFDITMNGVFKVAAWLDVDDDGKNTETQNEPGTIVYTNSGDFFLDLTYHTANDPTIYMGTVLSSSNTVNWIQFYADPNNQGGGGTNIAPYTPRIDVPSIDVPSGVEIALRSADEWDEDGWIVDREWAIVPQMGGTESFRGMSTLYKTFFNPNATMPMNVDVKLRVKDNRESWSPWAIITLRIQPQGATNQAPFVNIEQGNWLSVNAGQGFNLSAGGSYDPDGWISQYQWTVKDQYGSVIGNFNSYNVWLSFENPTASVQNFIVTLKVQDNQGLWSGDYSSTIAVSPAGTIVNNPPIADFYVSPALNVMPGTPMTFSSTSYDNETWISDLAWFVDGIQQFGYNGMNDFYWTAPSSGVHTIELRVTEAQSLPYYTDTRVVWASKNVNVIAMRTLSGFGLVDSGGTVPTGESRFFIGSNPSYAIQNVVLKSISGDIDLKIYTDASRASMIGGSYNGGSTDDEVSVSGYSSFYIEVYGYSGGQFEIWFE